jgi:peptidoglycan/LPS O-acetylase OafA/YrhL
MKRVRLTYSQRSDPTGTNTDHMSRVQNHIPALDGLRFIAASTVMISHAILWQYLMHGPLDSGTRPFLAWSGLHLANFGMTLFFVLSGFVIHYNYNATVQKPGGLFRFFVARWSRLYPLFILVFVAGLLHLAITQGVTDRFFYAVPLYLTFTESWWYWPVGGTAAASVYQEPFLGVLWSLSTEAFFYCIYPIMAPILAKLDLRKAGHGVIVVGVACFVIAAGFFREKESIYAALVPWLGGASLGQFVHWIAFNSPWIRLGEFILGGLVAQIYLLDFKLSPRHADYLAGICLTVIGCMFALMFVTKSAIAVVDMTMIAPAFALLCLAGACSVHSYFGRFLALRPMIWGGQASYSLYLIHSAVEVKLSQPIFRLYNYNFTYTWAFVSFITALFLARLLYVFYERPMTQWFRKNKTSFAPTQVTSRNQNTQPNGTGTTDASTRIVP